MIARAIAEFPSLVFDFTRHDKSRLLREKNLLRFTRATIFDTSLISTRDNQRIER